MKRIVYCLFFLCVSFCVTAQDASFYDSAMVHTVMTTWPDSLTSTNRPAKWTYDLGVILKGIDNLWMQTGDAKYFDYMQKMMDVFVEDNGEIRTYKHVDFNLDNILCGRILLTLFEVTEKKKYYLAASHLRDQLSEQPRTPEGGFWHKKIYPDQMWLDGLYMAEPFYAQWAKCFHEDSAFNDVARQFILMETNARDKKTGLLYHGYDASKKQAWANKSTGLSANFWARAMGWYGMALVDALDYFPANQPQRQTLINILNRYSSAVVKVQNKSSGLWWDVLNFPNRKGNYEEASASCMFVYTLAKGVRMGYLPSSYLASARKGYSGIVKKFVKEESGRMSLEGTVSVSGLGGKPYRDGSYEYYINEKVITNDPKGIGAFLLASGEMALVPTVGIGKGKTVTLDYYFNHELKKDITGKTVQFHYVWDEQDNNGYSIFKYIFNKYGVKTGALRQAPTTKNLERSSIYIIVDPDTKKETEYPNYISAKDVENISKWVANGGVLLLFGNDSGNAEFTHFNQLAAKFGIHLNEDSKNRVIGRQFAMGAISIDRGNPVFKNARKVYIKEYSSLAVTPPASVVVKEGETNVVAVSKFGKGIVFAVGDPWFYNEYTDGRKLPPEFQNYIAAEDVVKWAIERAKK